MKKILTLFVLLAFLAVGSTCLFSMIQVGEEVVEKIESPHPYKGKGIVWKKKFHVPDAGYIAIHFSNFNLAPGDRLIITDPDRKHFYKYKAKGKVVRGGKEVLSNFWATHIPGDTAIVALYSKGKQKGFGVVIDKWVHGYAADYIRTVMSGLEEDELSNTRSVCSSDDKEWAKCYEGTTMYNKSRAICRLLINGSSACTGWLLGSEGHVMTNEHCIGSQSDASNTDFEFMAEGSTCGTSCASWGACPGTVEASSSTLIQLDSALDFSLVLLPTNVTSTYGYMQLRDTLPSLDERIYIPQHPSAWGKQLAVLSDTDGPYAKIYSTNEAPCSGGPGDIGYYADTAGGSSGSPVLGYNDHLVVALHHCAACPNRGVPIPSIISDLGGNLPNDAIGGAVPTPPVADFTGSPTTVQEGSAVSFTDQSSNGPTSWSWSFEGGTPSTSTAQNPTVTYNTIGTYNVSLTATNAYGSDGETKTDYITVQEVVIQYCTASGTNQGYEWIAGVNVGDLNNTSGALGYSDFTSYTANLTADTNVSVSLTPGFASSSYTENWTIWIDYNSDGDFADAGEQVFQGSGSSTVTGSFTVPANASGLTRMRVGMQYNSYLSSSCGTFTYGEIEDYSVNISGATPQPPVANFTANDTTIYEGANVSFTDTSTENPTSWSWTFNGGTPSSSTAQNPTITYNTAGTYTVALTATNAVGSDTETKTNYIVVSVQPTTGTVGYTTAFGTTSTNGSRRAMPFTMPENGTITSVTMYHTGGSGDMILAVYDGSSAPTNRLAVTPTTAISSGTGWQTINLTSGAYVTGGSTVWLAWVYSTNPGIRYQTGSPGRYQSTATWSGGMPDPFGSGSQSAYLYSIYATYNK